MRCVAGVSTAQFQHARNDVASLLEVAEATAKGACECAERPRSTHSRSRANERRRYVEFSSRNPFFRAILPSNRRSLSVQQTQSDVPTCYLDLDGVVHHYNVGRGPRRTARMLEAGHDLFEWATVLSEALRPYPDVTIVLSTSWVRVLGYQRTKSYLPADLRIRVVGATYHRREHGATKELRDLWAQSMRGVQIALDLERRRPQRWFAIDDASDEFLPWQMEWLVPCEGATGLSAIQAQKRLGEVLERVHAQEGAHTSLQMRGSDRA